MEEDQTPFATFRKVTGSVERGLSAGLLRLNIPNPGEHCITSALGDRPCLNMPHWPTGPAAMRTVPRFHYFHKRLASQGRTSPRLDRSGAIANLCAIDVAEIIMRRLGRARNSRSWTMMILVQAQGRKSGYTNASGRI